MGPEKFVWLESVSATADSLHIATGAGYVTMQPDPQAYATVKEVLQDPSRGTLMSATALLSLRCGNDVRYPLLLRDVAAPVSPNRWQSPAGRCEPDELPLTCACRELCEELGIAGAVNDWKNVSIRVGGVDVAYVTQDTIHSLRARYAMHGNTVEFYYPMELQVDSFAGVRLFDREPYGRRVELFTQDELLALLATGRLADGCEAVVKAYFLPAAPTS